MKIQTLYENLDTSFVSLAGLIKYLRRREFTGTIRLELNGYFAEIDLDGASDLAVREHDRIADRRAEGEEALQRILIRAREAGGTISVYESIAETMLRGDESLRRIEPPEPETFDDSPVETQPPEKVVSAFALTFAGDIETRAIQNSVSNEDWRNVLDLAGELLGTFEKTLSGAGLRFEAAFSKTRAEIAGDYPFMNPEANVFSYDSGEIAMTERQNPTIFFNAVLEILRRMMAKLGAHQKYAEIYRQASQDLLALLRRRREEFERHNVAHPLEKILGA